ncbi:MAG: spermidine/putrescine ABC transporter substrate-binding protein [Clostridia bacterium]
MKKLMAMLLCLTMLLSLPTLSLAEAQGNASTAALPGSVDNNAGAPKVLNVLSWTGYVDDEILSNFEEETGIKVIWSPMDSIDDMLLKVSQNGGAAYDVILSSDFSLDILRQQGLLQKLDLSKLSNYGNLDPKYLGQYYDPTNEYVIPYVAGCPLIIYDPARVPFEITGYEDLWNPALQDSVATMDMSRILSGITLKIMGKSINEIDPVILAQAKEKLMPLYHNIRTFGDMEAYTAMSSGETSVAFMYTPFVYMVKTDFPDYKVVYPKEGLGYGIDGFVITADAANADNAHAFLDYLMIPEVAAHNAEYQAYMCVNKAATDYLSSQFLENPVVNVPDDLLAQAEFITNIGKDEAQYTEIYTAFKLQ